MKKNIFILFIISMLISCGKNETDNVIIIGSILNPKSKYVHITVSDSIITTKLDNANTFKFNIHLQQEGYYRFDHGEYTTLYLKPNEELNITLDANRFDETIKFDGSLGKVNNYLALNVVENEELIKLNRDKYYNYHKDYYNRLIDSIYSNRLSRLNECTNMNDSIFVKSEENKLIELKSFYLSNYDKMNLISKGKPAPEFISQDINGNKININDIKNKYKVIDVWATWCIGCRKESPLFEKLVEKYANKDILFISLSVDEDKGKWEKEIKSNKSKCIQLWIPNVMNSAFVENYNVPECGVPFFIVIDKENKIVDSRAPRPSENLEKIINSLAM